MDVAAITNVAFTSEDRVRDVIRNANADGFDSLYPRYKGKPQDRPLPGHGTNMPTWGGGLAAGLVAVNAATVKCPRMARSGCSVCAPDTEHVPGHQHLVRASFIARSRTAPGRATSQTAARPRDDWNLDLNIMLSPALVLPGLAAIGQACILASRPLFEG
jgi:hypothetical protein